MAFWTCSCDAQNDMNTSSCSFCGASSAQPHSIQNAARPLTSTEKRAKTANLMSAIGGCLLFIFGVCTVLYWSGVISKDITESLKVALAGPGIILLVIATLLKSQRKTE